MADVETPLVSVIIPVYNAEKYLEDSISSALTQTYENLELLVVDDGSTDGSGAIMDRMAKEDSRMRVFHEPHRGTSAARNIALNEARGDYICFIDADDHAYGDMIRMMVTRMEKEKADMAVFNVFEEKKHGLGGIFGWHIESNDLSCETIRSRLLMGDDAYVWRKIYRASLWKDLRFPEGQNHEEIYVNGDLLVRAGKIIASKQVLYIINHYKEKKFGHIDYFHDILDGMEAWMHNRDLAEKTIGIREYKEYYRWQARALWYLARMEMKEGYRFDYANEKYKVLFGKEESWEKATRDDDHDREVLFYHRALFKMYKEKEAILTRYNMDISENLKKLVQAAIESLCVDKVVNGLTDEIRKEMYDLVEEAREKWTMLTPGQTIMLTLVANQQEEIMKYKGRKYLQE